MLEKSTLLFFIGYLKTLDMKYRMAPVFHYTTFTSPAFHTLIQAHTWRMPAPQCKAQFCVATTGHFVAYPTQ
jgi:hypothetical protein